MSGLEMKYFLLKPRSKRATDPYAAASREAMKAYAHHIKGINPELAHDLLIWIKKEADAALDLIEDQQ